MQGYWQDTEREKVRYSLMFSAISVGLKPKLTTLLAVGSSLCGVSAIIATQGAIDADEEDSSFAIAAILTLGTIALFAFIGHRLHMSDLSYGLWAGLRIVQGKSCPPKLGVACLVDRSVKNMRPS